MKCIYCEGKTRVTNSRAQKKSNQTWRRRECQGCGAVFTSVEAIDLPTSLLFNPHQGHSEPFQREKLFVSVYEAVKHRNNAVEAATGLTGTIISKLLAKVENASINRQQVVSVTTEALKNYDRAASVQYQAYHPVK